jgi:Flp pilus assembly protein TadB
MAVRPTEVVRFIGRSSKRILVSVIGALLVLAGVAMLVLPGPGILVVALGFAVLGTEYAWAAAALERTKRAAAQAGAVARDGVTRAARGAQGGARSIARRVTRNGE